MDFSIKHTEASDSTVERTVITDCEGAGYDPNKEYPRMVIQGPDVKPVRAWWSLQRTPSAFYFARVPSFSGFDRGCWHFKRHAEPELNNHTTIATAAS